jgi:hypothetical protein
MHADQFDGLASLFDAYLGLQGPERIMLLYTSDATEAVALVSAGLSLRRITHSRVWMHPQEAQRSTGPGLAERWQQGLSSLGAWQDHPLIILSLERDTFSNAPEIARLMAGCDHADLRLYRIISACPELFATAMRAAPKQLSALNARLLETLLPERRLHLATAAGTDLQIEIDPRRYRWISNRGTVQSGRAVVLPAGEVATFPARIDGRFVADFAFNINCIVSTDARLGAHPVTLDLHDSQVTRFHCASAEMSALIETVLSSENGCRIGELGFGTNPCVPDAVALNSHINERHRGIHLGIGQHNQPASAVSWYCQKHLDLIADGGLITLEDGRSIDLSDLRPSPRPHEFSADVHDEDVFSPEEVRIEDGDCCGTDEVCWASPARAPGSAAVVV